MARLRLERETAQDLDVRPRGVREAHVLEAQAAFDVGSNGIAHGLVERVNGGASIDDGVHGVRGTARLRHGTERRCSGANAKGAKDDAEEDGEHLYVAGGESEEERQRDGDGVEQSSSVVDEEVHNNTSSILCVCAAHLPPCTLVYSRPGVSLPCSTLSAP